MKHLQLFESFPEPLGVGHKTNLGTIQDEYGDQFQINSNWYHKSLVKPLEPSEAIEEPAITGAAPRRIRKPAAPIKRLPFYSDCVGWRSEEIDLLHHLIDTGEDITYANFLSHVDAGYMRRLAASMNYSRSFPIQTDYHVRFRRAKDFDGKPAYYMVHSAIEYVFMEEPQTVKAPYVDDEDDDEGWMPVK